jgi:hypothetical protein
MALAQKIMDTKKEQDKKREELEKLKRILAESVEKRTS